MHPKLTSIKPSDRDCMIAEETNVPLDQSLRIVSHHTSLPDWNTTLHFCSDTLGLHLALIVAPQHITLDVQVPQQLGNFEEAHKPKSLFELVRAYGVFTTCQIRPIVQNADKLLNFTKKILGANITYNLVRGTFFGHFCAGVLAIAAVTGAL